MPHPSNDEYFKQLWALHVETLEKLKAQVAENAMEIAVMKTKIGVASAIGGSLGGIVAAVVIFFLKKTQG